MAQTTRPSVERIAVIGAGAAGLITAQVLVQDGFDVQILTRDRSVGGTWEKDRVYPGLYINNVHGEYEFTPLSMPTPAKSTETGGRLSGYDLSAYMEAFSNEFLGGRVRYETEVLNVRRFESGVWLVSVENVQTKVREVLEYSKIVLCTGGCSNPSIPQFLSPLTAENARFRGLVFHSSQYRSRLDEVLSRVKPATAGSGDSAGSIVIVGGGKSAQDIAAYLANEGRQVAVVFETADAFLANSTPLPDFIRKSRFLSLFSPHIELRSRLERFLHTTWLGSKLVHFVWNTITEIGFRTYSIPKDSPLRRAQSPFWGIRTNDEGSFRQNSFLALANTGTIRMVAPARVVGFADDGRSLLLNDGRTLPADVVILATGYTSSWSKIFDEATVAELGIGRHPPGTKIADTWEYTSMAHPPPSKPEAEQWASSIYRGLVPARNIEKQDLAINGATFTTNNGYMFEVSAHWISSYFLGDEMRLPSPEEAFQVTERNWAWLRKRNPNMLLWTNESYSSNLSFWNWPQTTDELLEDMGLPSMRSGGSWLTWPFKVISLEEISMLAEERRVLRNSRVELLL